MLMIRPQFAPEHPRQHLARAVEDRGEVQREQVIPPIDGKLGDRGDMLDAGVVHQDVHATEGVLREPDQLMDLFGSGEIGAVEVDIDTGVARPAAMRIASIAAGSPSPLSSTRHPACASCLGDSQADAAG